MADAGKGFFVVLLLVAVAAAWVIFKPFLTPLVLAGFTAALVMPLQHRLAKRMPRRLSAAIIILGVLLLVAAPIALLGYLLFEDIGKARDALEDKGLEERFDETLRPFLTGPEEEKNETLDQAWERLSGYARAKASELAGQAPTFLIDLLLGTGVVLFAAFFFIADADALLAYIRDLSPLPDRHTRFLLHDSNQTLHAVFFGQIVTGIVQGVIGGIGFWIVDLPGVLLWTMAMAILSMLPVVGAFLVWIPAAVYLAIQGDVWQTVFIIAWGLVPVGLTDNFLRPILMSGRTGLHPLLIFVAILGGVEAFGAVGLILGPLVVGVLMALLRVWRRVRGHHAAGLEEA